MSKIFLLHKLIGILLFDCGNQIEKVTVFQLALEIQIEYNSTMISSCILLKFLWFSFSINL